MMLLLKIVLIAQENTLLNTNLTKGIIPKMFMRNLSLEDAIQTI
jgi:hypothetical protein